MSIIQLQGINKTYFSDEVETPVLHNIDLTIKKGEFVSIMGPSGAGKSTLLHILGLLDPPTSGEYYFGGKKIEDYSDQELARIRNKKMGFVFQSFNLLSRTSVLENVELPLLYSHHPQKDWKPLAMKAIESVGLGHRVDHSPSQLSGGERQRVAIARALVNNPSVIFADEPTGNLDSKSGGQVMDTIFQLNQAGHTIVLITHEKYTAECAERIVHIVDGKIDSDKKNKNQRCGVKGFNK